MAGNYPKTVTQSALADIMNNFLTEKADRLSVFGQPHYQLPIASTSALLRPVTCIIFVMESPSCFKIRAVSSAF